MKKYIKSSAMKRSEISDEIQSHAIPLIESLAKLYLFPQYTQYHKHWRHEVWNELSAVPVRKKSHKTPKAEFILQYSWYRYKGKLKIIMSRAASKESELRVDKQRKEDIATLYNMCDEYFHWLAEYLHKFEMVDEPAVKSKLKELGL